MPQLRVTFSDGNTEIVNLDIEAARTERTKEILEMVKEMEDHIEMMKVQGTAYTQGWENFQDQLITRLTSPDGQ